MIKQNWCVSDKERNRILYLHENATKNNYLYLEQEEVKIGERIVSGPSLEVSLEKGTFPPGFYSIDKLTTGKVDLENKLKQVAEFVKKNKTSKVQIDVEVGESKLTPYDREKNTPLREGDLARLRGEKLVEYLTEYFQGLVNNGEIQNMPSIPRAKTNVELGLPRHEYKKGEIDPETKKVYDYKDPKYQEDQYVKFKISLLSQKVEDITKCLVNLVIDVSYNPKTDSKFPCRGGHTCDEAEFQIYLDKTLLGIANLNNKNCKGMGCAREAKFTVTADMVDKIQSDPSFNKKTMTLWTKCMTARCHTSVQEVKIINGKGEEIYDKCVRPMASRNDSSSKILAILDLCGKPISVTDNIDLDQITSLSDTINADNNSKIQEISKTTGLELLTNTTGNINFFDTYYTKKFPTDSIQVNGDFLTIKFLPTEDRKVQYFKNPLGGVSKINFTTTKGNPFVVNFPIVGTKINPRRIFKQGFLYRIPNTDYYAVTSPFDVGSQNFQRGQIIKLPAQ